MFLIKINRVGYSIEEVFLPKQIVSKFNLNNPEFRLKIRGIPEINHIKFDDKKLNKVCRCSLGVYQAKLLFY